MHLAEGTLTYRVMEDDIQSRRDTPRASSHTRTQIARLQSLAHRKPHYRPWNRRQRQTFNAETNSRSHTSCITNLEAHVLHTNMKSPQSEYSTCEFLFWQMHAFTGTSIHSNFYFSVAKYVFYQLKSVTLSCDLNIYAMFPGQCCITGKLFILVSVGPIFSVMIEYKMEAHSVVWRIIGRKTSVSFLFRTFVFPSHWLCDTVSVLYLRAFTFYFLVILLYIFITCFFCFFSIFILVHTLVRLSAWPWFTLFPSQCML